MKFWNYVVCPTELIAREPSLESLAWW